MKPLRIGVTGSAGSGKSLVCRRLGELGLAVLDCDVIAREVVETGREGFHKVVSLFGSSVVLADGTLDRPQMRHRMVNDKGLRKKLEAILHPLIRAEMARQMTAAADCGQHNAVAVEVPLLFESGFESDFDVTVVVTAREADLVSRVAKRDQVTPGQAEQMLGIQMTQAEKIRKADYAVQNRGTQAELFESVDNLFDKIRKEFLTM